MKRFLIILILNIVILLTSCTLFEGSNAVPPGKSRVSFTLPDASDTSSPNELIYIDLNSDNPVLKHISLEDGYNVIDLDKNGTHLLGLVNNSGIARSIGSTISTIGNIGIISNGLDSLPLSDNASDNIDLGELTENSETFSSDIDITTISDDTGYAINTLSGFGQFDGTTMKLLNPDIDNNGVYDSDENLTWAISSEYLFSYSVNSINMDTGEVTLPLVDFFVPSRKLIYFFADKGFNSLPDDLNLVKLIFPTDLTVIDEDDQIVTYINPRLKQKDADIYQFELTNIKDPTPFFDGDYRLDISGKYYYINKLQFVNPNNDYNGMLFPIFDALDNGTNFTKLRYRWKMVDNGNIRDALPKEIEMIVKYAHFEFVDNYPVYTFVINNLSHVTGEIDISGYGILISDFEYPGMSIRDASRNQYQFWYDFQE